MELRVKKVQRCKRSAMGRKGQLWAGVPGSFWRYDPALAMHKNHEVAQRWQAGIPSANEEPGKGDKNSLLEGKVSGLAWLLEGEAKHGGGVRGGA